MTRVTCGNQSPAVLVPFTVLAMSSPTIRAAGPDDAAAMLQLERSLMPFHVRTVDAVRRRLSGASPDSGRRFFKAEHPDHGGLVAFAGAGRSQFSSDPAAAWLDLVSGDPALVAPLVHELRPHLDRLGSTLVEAFVTPELLAAIAALGFTSSGAMHYLGLDLTSHVRAAGRVPDGLRMASTEQVDPRALHEADAEASLDEPQTFGNDGLTYDVWRREVWESGLDRPLGRVVLDGDHVVAFTYVIRADTRLWSDFTGVRPGYRGRGLATLVKAESLVAARAAGVTHAFTSTDETNVAMRAVNRRLGYEHVATKHRGLWRRPASGGLGFA